MIDLSPGVIAALGGFTGGMALGFAARWGRFCTLGAIEDACLGGSRGRLSAWGLAIAIAIFGTFALDMAGLIDITQSFYLVSPTTLLATAFGSSLFGLGMSLVGTCGYGTLARVGGGDLKSVVTFLVLGVTAYATMNGLSAYVRVYLFDVPAQLEHAAGFAHTAAAQFGGGVHIWAFIIAGLVALVALTSRDLRSSPRFLTAGIVVGLAIVSGWFVTGYLANDPFDPHRLESFTFTGPPGETLIYIMTATGASLKFGIGAVAGVIAGAAITTLAQKHFRWEACDDAREMRRQILGGALMGFGGVTALGCTVGQGLSAASLLAFTAPVALIAMFCGAWLGLQILVHGTIRDVWERIVEMLRRPSHQDN
jgi:uncharacterized membrane protein YedE/YeeE